MVRIGPIRLAVYDVTGRLVKRLAEGQRPSGRYQVVWDGRNGAGKPVVSGVYLIYYRTSDARFHRKAVLLK